MTNERHSDLLSLLLQQGQTSVQDMAEALGASLATVRRDLAELEEAGQVERLHGAARIAQTARQETAFALREQTEIRAKRVIASLAVEGIEPGETLFLDAGTTVLQLAMQLRGRAMPVRVFTNSLIIAQSLSDAETIDLTLIGGRLRPENMSMVGPLALQMLRGLWFDRVFLGATALDDHCVIRSHDVEEAAVNAEMMARSAQTVLLADHSKFSNRATYLVGQLGQGHGLVTDRAPSAEMIKRARELKVGLLYPTPKPVPSERAMT